MINVPRSSPDDHYFCSFFFSASKNNQLCAEFFSFYPRIFKFLDNWSIIYIPWLSNDCKTFSDFPRLFQFFLTWTNPAVTIATHTNHNKLLRPQLHYGVAQTYSHNMRHLTSLITAVDLFHRDNNKNNTRQCKTILHLWSGLTSTSSFNSVQTHQICITHKPDIIKPATKNASHISQPS